jgi:hypothetical protein
VNRPFNPTAASQPHEAAPRGISGADRGAAPGSFEDRHGVLIGLVAGLVIVAAAFIGGAA